MLLKAEGVMNTLLFISGQEIVIVFVVVLLLFGANKIPEVARGLGKGMREFRKATDDIKKEINDNAKDIIDDVDDMKDNLTNIK